MKLLDNEIMKIVNPKPPLPLSASYNPLKYSLINA